MNGLDFWSNWKTPYRLTFKILAVFLFLMTLGVLVIEVADLSYFYDWNITASIQEVDYPVFSNHSDLVESTITTEVSFILQKVSGGFRLLPEWLVFAYAGILYLSIAGIATIVSFLSRFWFVICAGLFILLITGAGIGRIGVLGLQNEYAIGLVAMIFVLPGYYFNSIREDIPLSKRFLANIALMILAGFLIHFTSDLSNPLMHLAYFSYWPALSLTVLFLLIVGHEIVYAILILTTQGSGDKENTKHFIVLSLVYLVNIGLIYSRNAGYLNWDIYYINVYLLLSISAILGIWGLKGREVLYGNSLPFYPYAIFLYLGLAIVSLATILFFMVSGNDSSLEVVEDAIVFGHLGFGAMFMIYILANFISLLIKGLPVYKIAFKEDNFPYATSRIGGMIVVAAFFFASNNAPLYQSVSGYFNGLGDMNLMFNRHEAAHTYYDLGSKYGNTLLQSNGNHKSNYMLGALERNPEKIAPHAKNALKRNPSEYAFTTLGLAYEEDNRFFDALFTYQEGLKEFPKSWAIKNNLALLYNRTDVTDSILFYLKNENSGSWNDQLIASNLAAIASIRNFPIADLIDLNEFQQSERLGGMANYLGYKVVQNVAIDVEEILQLTDPQLHLYTFGYYKNLGLLCFLTGNDVFLKVVDPLISSPANVEYRRDLQFLKGLNMYAQGNISEAFHQMRQIREESVDEDGMINALLGKWSMELGSPYQGSKYFELAREAGFAWATADLAQGYTQVGKGSIAQFIVQKEIDALDSADLEFKPVWERLLERLQADEIEWRQAYSFEREMKELNNLESKKSDTSAQVANRFEVLASKNPFFEKGVLSAVQYFNDIKAEPGISYEILVNAISVNEHSEALIKAYIVQCFKMGLTNYAEDTILRLYEILSLEDFHAFELEFEKMKSDAQANLENW